MLAIIAAWVINGLLSADASFCNKHISLLFTCWLCVIFTAHAHQHLSIPLGNIENTNTIFTIYICTVSELALRSKCTMLYRDIASIACVFCIITPVAVAALMPCSVRRKCVTLCTHDDYMMIWYHYARSGTDAFPHTRQHNWWASKERAYTLAALGAYQTYSIYYVLYYILRNQCGLSRRLTIYINMPDDCRVIEFGGEGMVSGGALCVAKCVRETQTYRIMGFIFQYHSLCVKSIVLLSLCTTRL